MLEDDAASIHNTLIMISAKLETQNKRIGSQDVAKLTMAEGRALFFLKGLGATHMSRIADILGVAVSTATSTVDRLVAKKLARRRVSDDDRRKWLVELTPKAGKLVAELDKCAIEGTKRFLECLSASEVAFLKTILDKIDNGMRGGRAMRVTSRRSEAFVRRARRASAGRRVDG